MKKILIIEDDPVVAHIYRSRLEKEGYNVEAAEDGQTGFYRIHEFHPDGVLLDLMLPKMNGVEILKKIRAQSQFAHTPILVFTNAYVPNMIQEAQSAGASHVFNKATITPRQILDTLQLLLSNQAPAPQSGPTLLRPPVPEPNKPSTGRGDPLFSNPATPAVPPTHAEGSPPPPRAVDFSKPLAKTQFTGNEPHRGRASSGAQSEDDAFQAELFEAFTASKSETLSTLRRLLHDFNKAPSDAAREPHLLELYRKVHSLTGSAGIAGFLGISQLAAALEVLLKELQEKPKNINASTMRTVAHSIDFLGELFKSDESHPGIPANASILVVDDEILSRRAVTYALEKASLKSTNVEDPIVALKLATENVYDLIFLDVQMPGMDGFELCTKIRGLSTNKTTPIIFVTSLTDFKSRAKSSLCGGNDLIAKPFMFIELTVKALAHVLRSRQIQRQKAA